MELIPIAFNTERIMTIGILQSMINTNHRWKIYRTTHIANGMAGSVGKFVVRTLAGEHVDTVAIKQDRTNQLDEYVANILGLIHTCPSIRVIHLPLKCTGTEDVKSGYTMMTLMDGSLADLIKTTTVSKSNQHHIMYQLASTLRCFKNKGLLYTDIKPDNILYRKTTAGYDIVLGDIASFVQSPTGLLVSMVPPNPRDVVNNYDTFATWLLGVILYHFIDREDAAALGLLFHVHAEVDVGIKQEKLVQVQAKLGDFASCLEWDVAKRPSLDTFIQLLTKQEASRDMVSQASRDTDVPGEQRRYFVNQNRLQLLTVTKDKSTMTEQKLQFSGSSSIDTTGRYILVDVVDKTHSLQMVPRGMCNSMDVDYVQTIYTENRKQTAKQLLYLPTETELVSSTLLEAIEARPTLLDAYYTYLECANNHGLRPYDQGFLDPTRVYVSKHTERFFTMDFVQRAHHATGDCLRFVPWAGSAQKYVERCHDKPPWILESLRCVTTKPTMWLATHPLDVQYDRFWGMVYAQPGVENLLILTDDKSTIKYVPSSGQTRTRGVLQIKNLSNGQIAITKVGNADKIFTVRYAPTRTDYPRQTLIVASTIAIAAQLGERPSIALGNYLFRLIEWNPSFTAGHGRCTLSSTNLSTTATTTFYVYPSQSELGTWRLWMELTTNGQRAAYKGTKDYVQQTMIHAELQRFLHAQVHTIPVAASATTYNAEETKNHIDAAERQIVLCAECATCGDKRTNQPRSIISAANKLQDLFSLPMDRAPTHMYAYEYTYSNMEASCNIYEVVLVPKTTQQHTVRLCYIHYNLYLNGVLFRRDQFMSLYITADSSSITQYGTLSEYASAGVNLCKMLEYHHQVDETVGYERIDETYIYFADTYQAVFPVSSLRELHRTTSR